MSLYKYDADGREISQKQAKARGIDMPDGPWWHDFTVAGRRHRESTHTEDFKQAVKEERKRRAELEAQAPKVARGIPTLRKLADADIAHARDAKRGADIHIRGMERLWKLVLANLPAACLYPQDVTADVLADYKVKRLAAKVLPQTINGKELAAIRRVLAVALKKGWIAQMPEWPERERIRAKDRDGKQRGAFIDAVDLDKVLAELKPGNADAARFVLDTGLRLYELIRSRWSWIDVDADGKARLNLPAEATKSGESRTIYLTATALDIALRRHEQRGDELFADAEKMTLAMRRASKRAGLDYIVHMRDLRHTFASRLINRRVPLKVVSDALGHSDVMTTMLYLHTDTSQRSIVAETGHSPCQSKVARAPVDGGPPSAQVSAVVEKGESHEPGLNWRPAVYETAALPLSYRGESEFRQEKRSAR